ncbi:hypothetical protein BD770DRAFT_396317, partial [Pilaira anomala]
DSSFTPIKLSYARQIATKIQTACTNAITKDFGNKLRMVASKKLIGLQHRISQLTSDLKKQGYSKEETKAKITNNILESATQLKLAIPLRDISRILKKFQDQKAIINYIKDIFSDKDLDGSMKFRGTIMTDGIGISMIKQNFDTSKGGTREIKKQREQNQQNLKNCGNSLNQKTLRLRGQTLQVLATHSKEGNIC